MILPDASSGTYEYLCNGEASGVSETWDIQTFGNEHQIECVRKATPVGVTLRTRSLSRDGDFQRCMLLWQQQRNDYTLEVSADYCFDGTGLTIYAHNGTREVELREEGRDFLFSPLMRIYNGAVIAGLLESDGQGQVLVPWIKSADQPDKLLRPEFSQRQARLVGESEMTVAGTKLSCKEYDYSGGEYQPGTRFWIDERGVMLRYSWQQDEKSHWEISLSDYRLD